MLALGSAAAECRNDVGEVVAAAIAGDAAAWNQLVAWYTPLLWKVARGEGLAVADAADVVQTAWLKLVEHLSKVREPRAVGAWLRTTAQRESRQLRRRAGRTELVPMPDALDLPDPTEAPDEQVQRRCLDERVDAAIDRLSEVDRRFLGVLMASPEPTYQEVAASLGRPVGSIGPTRARCLARLRRELCSLGVEGR